MEIAVKINEKMAPYIQKPYDGFIEESVTVELYREGKLTLRQAAEILNVSIHEMFKILAKRKTYINYGYDELDEEISYANS